MTCHACHGTGTTRTTIDGIVYHEPCNCEAGEGLEYVMTCEACGTLIPEGSDSCENCDRLKLTATQIAEGLQEALAELVMDLTDGAVTSTNTEGLVIWNGDGFRVTLSNGQTFDLVVTN